MSLVAGGIRGVTARPGQPIAPSPIAPSPIAPSPIAPSPIAGAPIAGARITGAPIPPAPRPPARDLPGPALLWTLRRNSLAAWPGRSYVERIVHRRFLGTDCYLVNDPAAIRHVLTEAGTGYVRPTSIRRLMLPCSGNGLLVAEGAEWRAQRRMLSAGFSPRHVESLLPEIGAAADALIDSLGNGGRLRLGEILECAAIDAAGRTMLGLSLTSSARRIGRLLRGYFTGAAKAQIFDFLATHDADFAWATMRRASFSRRWFAEIEGLIAMRRGRPPGDDLFSLLTPRIGHGTGMRDQLGAMLAAGFETTALLMIWTLYLLATAPEVQAAIRAELRTAPPANTSSTAYFDNWPRLRACLLETLRLFPPTSVVSRVPLSPDVLCGVRVAAGALVMISPWVLHRHRLFWTSPERFQPERFHGESLAASLKRPGFLPFGGGSRTCLGAGFAMSEATLFLARILARFDVRLEPGQRVMPRAIVTTRPDPQPWFLLTELGT